MAEYVRTARVEDTGAKIMFALRSGTSRLLVDQLRQQRVPHAERLCRSCTSGAVEDAYHALAECSAHAAARASLRAKLPPALQDVTDRRVFNALMGAANLRVLCDETPVRQAATEAVKCFWVRVLGPRRR